QMRLRGGNGHDAVARDAAADIEREAVVAREQAVAKDPEAPWIVVRRPFDGGHGLQIRRLHEADFVARTDFHAHRSLPNRSLTMQRPVHALAFSPGLRSR